ncbi:hypothetical protein [Rheinheimera sp.]|uniref:hypothetical protein n=1 Tax=Rheinheimera sp. TaxID=1869214 RepID=UPI00307FABC0
MQPHSLLASRLHQPAALSAEQKQQSRRHCGFGCIFCGCPVYQYFQLEGQPELLAICPLHQRQLQKNLLSPSTLEQRAQHPINLDRQHLPGFKFDPDRRIQLSVGMNTLYADLPDAGGEHPLIWVNGQVFFCLHADRHWLSFSFVLSDTQGQPLVQVVQGELQHCPAGWEFSYEVMTLKIRDSQKRLVLTAQLCNDRVLVTKGLFLDPHKDGFAVEGNRVIAMLDGQKGGEYMQRLEPGRYQGGWALFNKVRYPELVMPGSFAFICATKRKSL